MTEMNVEPFTHPLIVAVIHTSVKSAVEGRVRWFARAVLHGPEHA
jgi:hypothetical protein